MKKLFLLLTAIGLTFQSCSNSDDPINEPVLAVCDIPINLSVSEITEASAVLNWDNSNTDLDVKVEYGLAGFSPGTGTVILASQNSIGIEGLTSDTSYDFYVQAICAVTNTSVQSGVASFTTYAECNTPINLSVSEVAAYSAVFSWENPNDNLDVKVEYGLTGFSLGNGTVILASQNSISIEGLTPNTSYDFYVQAICADTNTSAQSGVASFTTNISPFAGTWSGTYDGDDSGTWTFVVSASSIITESTAFSNNVNEIQQGAVGDMIPASGSVITTAPNGTQTTAQLTGDTLSGTWVNPSAGNISGTLTGSRE